MDESNPYKSPIAEEKPVQYPRARLGMAEQPPARPMFRAAATLIAAIGVTMLFFVKLDPVGLMVIPWFCLEMAWIGLTGYGLYFGRRICQRPAAKPERFDQTHRERKRHAWPACSREPPAGEAEIGTRFTRCYNAAMREVVGGFLMLLGIVLAVAGLIILTAARVHGGPLGGNDVLAGAAVVIGGLFITACAHQLVAAEPPKRKRGWFQFSLRMLLIGVTSLAVVCGYMGHEREIVQARQTWLKEHSRLPLFGGSNIPEVLVKGDGNKLPSLIRRWLGDSELREWEVFWNATPDQLSEISSLFPEATIFWDRFREQPERDLLLQRDAPDWLRWQRETAEAAKSRELQLRRRPTAD